MANIPNNRWGPRKWKWTLWTRTLSSGSLDLESVKKPRSQITGFRDDDMASRRRPPIASEIPLSIHAITDEADIYLKDSRKGTRR